MDKDTWVPDSHEAGEEMLHRLCSPETLSDKSLPNKDDSGHNERTIQTKLNTIIINNNKPTFLEKDETYEKDQNKFWSCKNGMLIISGIKIIFFIIDSSDRDDSEFSVGPISDFFLYDPDEKYQIWRYFTYMFFHKDCFHLGMNIFLQIALGTPLESVNSSWRVLTVYFVGGVAGSLCFSITNPTLCLIGASGGVYALVGAHTSTLILKWRKLNNPVSDLLYIAKTIGVDICISIYVYFESDIQIAHATHFGGFLSGFLVGILVLKKLKVTRTHHFISRITMVVYVILILIEICLNVFLSFD